MFNSQQQNAIGSLHNIDFGVFWASWGGSRKEPGSGNRFREVVPGTIRWVPTGQVLFPRFGRNRVPGTKGIKKDVYLCTLKVYFCTSKVHFCTLKVYFCTSQVYCYTSKVYFCTLKGFETVLFVL